MPTIRFPCGVNLCHTLMLRPRRPSIESGGVRYTSLFCVPTKETLKDLNRVTEEASQLHPVVLSSKPVV